MSAVWRRFEEYFVSSITILNLELLYLNRMDIPREKKSALLMLCRSFKIVVHVGVACNRVKAIWYAKLNPARHTALEAGQAACQSYVVFIASF